MVACEEQFEKHQNSSIEDIGTRYFPYISLDKVVASIGLSTNAFLRVQSLQGWSTLR